jgi:hypothetical protein
MAIGKAGGVDVPFPVRGTPSGWRDVWDDPDDSAELRAKVEATEAHLLARVAITGRRWQQEIAQARKRRGGSG